MIELYTDGSGTTQGPIGWAWIVVKDDQELAQGRASDASGTCNIAELRAIIDGLEHISKDYPDHMVTVFSDSAYVVNCFKEKWYEGWFKRKWKNSRGRKVANREYWEQLLGLAQIVSPDFEHIPGHSGIKFNEMADSLANQARKEHRNV